MIKYDSDEIIDRASLIEILKLQFGKDHYFADYIVDELYEVFKDFSINEVGNIINGAKKKMILMHEEGFFNLKYFGNVKQVLNDILEQKDFELYNQINRINKRLATSLKTKEEKKGLVKTMNDLWKIISKSNKNINSGLQDFSRDSLKIFEALAAIYSVLIENLGNTKDAEGLKDADKAVLKIAEKLKSYSLEKFDYIQIESIKEFLSLAVDDNDENLFKQKEMLSLISKAPSILTTITKEKFIEVNNAIKSHLLLLEHKYKVTLDMKAKDVILNSGTILSSNTENLLFTSTLLLGGTIGDAVNVENKTSKYYTTKKEQLVSELISCMGDAKIEGLDLKLNLYMLEHPSYWANLNVKNLYARIDDITNCLCSVYDAPKSTYKSMQSRIDFLKMHGFDVKTMIHKDNFIELCDRTIILARRRDRKKQSYDNKNDELTSNLKLLSKIIPGEEIHKIITHNLLFLLQNPEDLEMQIKKIAKSSKNDFNKFKDKINKFVNKVVSLEQQVSVKRTLDTKPVKRTTKSGSITLKPEKIVLESFDMDEQFLQELGFEIPKEPEVPAESLKDKLYFEITTELEGIYEFYNLKLNKKNNSKIISSIIDVLFQKDRKENLTDIKLLSKVSMLEKKIKEYCTIASNEEIEELLENIKYAQYSVVKSKETLKQEIELGKEVVTDSYLTIHKQKPAISSKKLKETEKFVKENSQILKALGITVPNDSEIADKAIKQAKQSEQKIKEERRDTKLYTQELLSNIVVLKVYEKLDKVLSNVIENNNVNLVSKKSIQIDKEAIITRISELKTERDILVNKIKSLKHSIEVNDKELSKFRSKEIGIRTDIFRSDNLNRRERTNNSKKANLISYQEKLEQLNTEIEALENLIK